MRNQISENRLMLAIDREALYAAQERQALNIVAIVFVSIMLITRIDRMYTNIANPFGLPGGMSQFIFYAFGLGFLLAVKDKEDLQLPWSKSASILWVAGLTLASFTAIHFRIALVQAISFALYLLVGYGVFKACLDDQVLRHFSRLTILIGIGWSLVIIYVFFKNGGSLPYEYIAFQGVKGTFNHHSYALLIANGGVVWIALLSKKRGKLWYSFMIPLIISGTLFAIIVSQARANFLAFATTCSYILLQNENIKGRGTLIIKAAWVAITIIVIIWGVKQGEEKYEDVYKRFDFQDEEYQLKKSHGRPEMIKKALILISKHPFGVGGGNARFTNVGRQELMRIEGFLLHNQYLSSIAEGGWVVILSWFLILKGTLVQPFRHKWKKPERLAIYGCWMNYCIDGFFADMIGDYFFLLLFVVSSAIALEKRDESE